MPAIHVNDDQFEERVLQSDQPVIVDFWAEWCGPCQLAGPVLDKLADKYEGKVVVIKVNVDESTKFAGQYGVMSIPTVILFKDGKEVERKIGYGGESGYEELIRKVTGH